MKQKAPLYIALLLLTTLFLSVLPISGEAEIYQDVIRLHILADSDSAEAQAAKIAVRDGILDAYGERLSTASTRAEAEAMLRPLLPAIEKTALAILAERGEDCTVTAELATEYYATRVYQSFRMPAGEYLSLSIRIGEGTGQNFFCVLFPPLCTDSAFGEQEGDLPAGLSPEEYELITGNSGGYRVKFKLLEVVSTLFS